MFPSTIKIMDHEKKTLSGKKSKEVVKHIQMEFKILITNGKQKAQKKSTQFLQVICLRPVFLHHTRM